MSRGNPGNFALASRWGAVSMAQGCDLETRLRGLLLPNRKRESPRRMAAAATLATAITTTVAMNVVHLQEASATTRKASATTSVQAQRVPGRYAVAVRNGVVFRAIAVSARASIDVASRSNPEQKWWRPDGTLYAGRPDVGTMDKMPVQLVMPIPPEVAKRRRLWFVLELSGALKEDDVFAFDMRRSTTAGDFSTSENMGNGRLLLHYCSLEPADRSAESFEPGLAEGPWKTVLRLPIPGQPEQASQLRDELVRLQNGARLPDAGHLYAPDSGSSEFKLIRPRGDSVLAHGEAERFELLDSKGHRLAKGRSQYEKDVSRDYIIMRFNLDKDTARRARYMAIVSSPFKHVTIRDVAVAPGRMPAL